MEITLLVPLPPTSLTLIYSQKKKEKKKPHIFMQETKQNPNKNITNKKIAMNSNTLNSVK